MAQLDPEDRYPHRFDELWPRPDKVAYLSDGNIFGRDWLVDEIGRLLEDDDIHGDRLNANNRVPIEVLAEILIDLRDQRRTIRRLTERLHERERNIKLLERRLKRLREQSD